MKSALAYLYLTIPLALLSCANQTTPEGGPKDVEPPKMIRSSPAGNATRFQGEEVELLFNETIQLNNPKEEIIIVPSPGKKTQFKTKTNRVIIQPENRWRENTTYTINFRESIEDITEGNPVQDLQLAFSTGSDIDSLVIAGSVNEALKEAVPEKITVAIYQSDTFNIFEHAPEYFTRTNKEGEFRITNLKPGTYRLYAFDDKNKNLKAESRTERFGFLAEPIRLDTGASNLRIALVNVDSRPLKMTSVRNQSTVNTIRFNKAIESYVIKSPRKILNTFGATQAEIIAHFPEPVNDSVKVSLTAVDSLSQEVDTVIYLKGDDREKIEESFRVGHEEPTYNIETGDLQVQFSFNKPIAHIRSDSLRVELDSLHFLPIPVQDLLMDTLRNRITIDTRILVADSIPSMSPFLKTGTGFLVSIDGDSSRSQRQPIKVLDSETTAVLQVDVQTNEPHFLIQILNSAGKLIRTSRDQKKVTFRYLPPEAVKIRLIIDSNGNGAWDTANYLDNREPEKTLYYMTPDKKFDTPLRANWEVGPLLLKF